MTGRKSNGGMVMIRWLLKHRRNARAPHEDAAAEPGGGGGILQGRPEAFLQNAEGMISLEEALLLYDLARRVREGCIVEVGSYRGRSAVALGRGSIDGHRVPVYAIEPHETFRGILGGSFGPADRGAFYRAMLATSCYHVVRLVNLSSEQVAPSWGGPVALLFIDGDHSDAGVRRDFDCWAPHLTPDARVAFDDATNPDLGPRRLIRELVASGRYVEEEGVGKIALIRAAGERGA